MTINDTQRKALERFLFVYGNYGPKHTWGNHKFIQILLERGEDDRNFFRGVDEPIDPVGIGHKIHRPLTAECEAAVDAILRPHDPEDWDSIDNRITGDRSEL